MNFLLAMLLGTLQGLTEFLPVSSSGHLVIAQSLLPNFSQPGVLFDVTLHAGTLFSIIIYFRKRLEKLIQRNIYLLIIGSIPAGLVGVFFQTALEGLFNNIKFVGLALLFTGLMNLLSDKAKQIKKELSLKDALLVGVAQAVAIIPGISRSGSTIFAGTIRGARKKDVAEFSFLLSVPAVFGASFIQLTSYSSAENIDIGFYVVGFIAALLSGYIAIDMAISYLIKRKFRYFSLYCFILGLGVLFLL